MTDERILPEAELARLADGSLPAGRAAELRAAVAASPRLAASLAEQERALALVRSLDAPAPERLRARIAADRRAARRRRRIGRALALPAATSLAILVAAVVVVLTGPSTGGPDVSAAARLALAPATLPAPGADAADPAALRLTAAGIPFPNWADWTGYAAVGARRDRVAGRTITTVFYRDGTGRRVGYAIVSGPALAALHGRTETAGGVRFTLARAGSGRLITWTRSGHTCVVASRALGDAGLIRLVERGGGAS